MLRKHARRERSARQLMHRIIIAAFVALIAGLALPATVPASPGCKTKACERRVCESKACKARVAEKALARLPMRPAVASWYGPGLYGNPLACGGRLYAGTHGVAHKTLRCGTRVRVCKRSCITVRVIDRGPYVGGREFDLTAATSRAIGHSGVQTIRVRVG